MVTSDHKTIRTTACKMEKRYDAASYRAVIMKWQERHSAVDICLRSGMYGCSAEPNRLLWWGSTTRRPGVIILDGGRRIYSYHRGDPLCTGAPLDAYDCLRILKCGGDHVKTIRKILQEMGVSAEPDRQILRSLIPKR